MSIHFTAMPTKDAEAFWNGGTDAYGLTPDTMVSDGPGHPCRHCLANIDEGEKLLVFAYRPFPEVQAFAETGPIFLHAKPCKRYAAEEVSPAILATSPDFILRGYNEENRIVYGTGKVTPIADIPSYSEALFVRDDIAYVHVRSARNSCYQCRIDRA
ncbi:DUF1203 domain-containing protein [Rhizobium sp. TH2]|uniref:DUF1203 domain-containing protein n=1 Tax=Rhizobium sp. TH2 TaxID=2775403 RepID=UPI00215886DD|nr:DUF1203 domain-containing protein [Rhizobium sp. TH2]UVC11203.1 DUF1203 domain-containing protein [Rhizobium sp. TH2]